MATPARKNSTEAYVEYDAAGLKVYVQGTTVPSNDTAGYAKGCIFIDTDVAKGTSGLYQNKGSSTECTFELVPVASTGSVTDMTVSAKFILSGVETIAGGGTTTALALTKSVHSVDADAGGDTFTLADGTIGQVMTIVMASSTGTATVTPANLAGGTSVTLNAAGDSVILQFVGTEWYILGGNSYAVV